MRVICSLVLLALLFLSYAPQLESQISATPTVRPSNRPTPRPSAKKTKKPTFKPTFRKIGIYGEYGPDELPKQETQQIIVGILILLLLVLMAMDISFLTPEVLFLVALIIVILSEILTLAEGLAGFANTAVITIGTLFLVIAGVEKSHFVDWLARKSFGSKGPLWLAATRMYWSCFGLSVFFNNTPLVALLIPIVKDWARVRGVSASQFLMPLSFAVLSGSFGSMIGTSTNLTVQGLMEADRKYSFDFFAPLPIGIVCAAALILYMVIAGPYILPNDKNGLIRELRDKSENLIAEVYVAPNARAIGMSLGDVMISLGLAPSYAIKIRRKIGNSEATDAEAAGANSVDKSYIAKHLEHWQVNATVVATKITRSLSFKKNDYAEVNQSEYDAGAEDYTDMISPSFHEVVRAGDIIYMSYAQDVVEKMMKSILGESDGLYLLKSNAMSLPGYGTEILECVVSDTSPLLGRTSAEASKIVSERYNSGLITVRGKDWSFQRYTGVSGDSVQDEDEGKANDITKLASEGDVELTVIEDKGEESNLADVYTNAPTATSVTENPASAESDNLVHNVVLSKHIIRVGDVILMISDKKKVDDLRQHRDFFVVSSVGELPKPMSFYSAIPIAVFMTMLILVALERIDICPAAVAVTCFFFLGGWITFKDIPKYVDIRLLMLLGTSLSFATAMSKSGLALRIAKLIKKGNPSNFDSIILVYAVTLAITELISNNAAAALMYPIAVGIADELSVSFKPFAMTVLVASTAGFMSPIGYQTHVMVWGPGGYKFRDFIIFGIIPDILYWFIACAMIPALYPFDE